MQSSPVCLLILISCLLQVGCGQDGWETFEPGDPVIVHRKGGSALEGTVAEITGERIRVQLTLGSVLLQRDRVERLERPAAGPDQPAEPGEGPAPADAAIPVEIPLADGEVVTVLPGTEVCILTRKEGGKEKLYRGWRVVAVEDDHLKVEMGGPFLIPLDEIIRIEVTRLPQAGTNPDGMESQQVHEVGDSDPWPPAVGSRIRFLVEGDSAFLHGEVLELEEDPEQQDDLLLVEVAGVGVLRWRRSEITFWQVVGTAISHQTLARLIRYYGLEVNPSWATTFLQGGPEQARHELQQLSAITVKPDPVFRIAQLPVEPASTKGETFERQALRQALLFQRQRYLMTAERELEYLLQQELVEDPQEAQRMFNELRRGDPELDIDFPKIGTAINNRLVELGNQVRELETTRVPQEEIDAARQALGRNREAHRRYSNAMRTFVRYRRLTALPDADLDAAVKRQGTQVYRQFSSQLDSTHGGASQDEIASWNLTRSWVVTLELTEPGRDRLLAELEDLYEHALRAPLGEQEWLFNRKLRHLPCTLLPSRGRYSLDGDRGHCGVYHLNVYRYQGAELCRMAIFRIEPKLHVRILFYQQRLLFSEAEEWINR
jgi:hypothetical protein